MQKILGVAGLLVLLAALAGGVYLSQKSQETRRGAAGDEWGVQFLPSEIKVAKGATFKATVSVNFSSKQQNTIRLALFNVSYDRTKLKLTGYKPLLLGMGTLGESADDLERAQSGYILPTFTGEADLAGVEATKVMELTFTVVGDVPVAGLVVGLSRMVYEMPLTAQLDVANRVDVGSLGVTMKVLPEGAEEPTVTLAPTVKPTAVPPPTTVPTSVPTGAVSGLKECRFCGTCQLVDVGVRLTCPTNVLGPGEECQIVGGVCQKVSLVSSITPTPTSIPLKCGGRCYGNDGCATGYGCYPVGMDGCGGISWPTVEKVVNGEGLNSTETTEIDRACPDTAELVVDNIVADPDTLIGICRKKECLTEVGCVCGSLSPTLTPTPTPMLGISENRAVLSLAVDSNNKPIVVGDVFKVKISYWSGDKKVSAMKAILTFPVGSFKVEGVADEMGIFKRYGEGGGSDSNKIELNMVASRPAAELMVQGQLAEITLKALMPVLNSNLQLVASEVVGIDSSGNNISFVVPVAIVPVVVGAIPTIKIDICQFCPGGMKRVAGDANCDGKINMLDFEIWRGGRFDKLPLSQMRMASFSCGSEVKMEDFDIWRKAMFE